MKTVKEDNAGLRKDSGDLIDEPTVETPNVDNGFFEEEDADTVLKQDDQNKKNSDTSSK